MTPHSTRAERPTGSGESADTTVLAALDASALARNVLRVALNVAELAGATVEAVHVAHHAPETPRWLASRADVPLRLLTGAVNASLRDALAEPRVIAAVVGAKANPADHRPVGRTARHLLEHARKPVVVVPLDVHDIAPGAPNRVLVPLEGTRSTSHPVTEALTSLFVTDVEPIAVHVFTPDTLPHVLDHPERDLPMWSSEFIAQHCPTAVEVELRTGTPASEIASLCNPATADLVALSWSCDMSHGHARVVQEVLERSSIPVLLLPADATV